MNRERKPTEYFKTYRKNQNREAKKLKERLKGRFIWRSAILVPKPYGGVLELAKAAIQGTYIRGKCKLSNCQSDKNRFDRMKAKAERKLRGQNET